MTDPTEEEALQYFESNYALMSVWHLPTVRKVVLAATADQTCRFCGRQPPEVSYKLEAHALPESIGNRSLVTKYECDLCNEFFGNGIENDFGNWSKPARTFSRVEGKKGVPTLKKGSRGGWRIEFGDRESLEVTGDEANSIFEDDQGRRRLTFRFKRDPYTPIAVLKAFVKMGISLLPHSEISNFRHAIAWLRSENHGEGRVNIPLLHTFVAGSTARGKISAAIMRRTHEPGNVPYALFLLFYGNDLFQVNLPCPAKDGRLYGGAFPIVHFPLSAIGSERTLPSPRREVVDLTGRDLVRDGTVEIVLEYGAAQPAAPLSGQG
jgi:hypothetical protein